MSNYDEETVFEFEENLDQFRLGLKEDDRDDEYYTEPGCPLLFSPKDGFVSTHGKLVPRDWRGKKCRFIKNRNPNINHLVPISDAKYRSMDTLLNDLSVKMQDDLPFGVRSIHTPKTGTEVKSLDQLENGKSYVVREITKARPVKDLDKLDCQRPSQPWTHRPPLDTIQEFNNRLTGKYLDSWYFEKRLKHPKKRSESRQMEFRPKTPKDEHEMLERTPKKMTVYRNGCWLERHLVLLNKRSKYNTDYFEALLQDIGDMFGMPFNRLLKAEEPYELVTSIKEILQGPEVYIALQYQEKLIKPETPLRAIGSKKRDSKIDPALVDGSGVVRKGKSMGRWRVKVITADEPGAGTTANVVLTVYGEKKDSGPIHLPREGKDAFSEGSIDETEVKTGRLGSIYKIRIEHDNSGPSPDWKCLEVHMTDVNTERALIFPVNRWLSRNHEDGDIVREVPMMRKGGEGVHPLVTYIVRVTTGDRWGAGTDAPIFVNLIGERGDTGRRFLNNPESDRKLFKKSQTDEFTVEAVSLGRIKKIQIGHEKTKAGEGWFLDRVTVQAEDSSRDDKNKAFNFPCARWLDVGQDDRKIVREIFASEQLTGVDSQKETWEIEKWKYEKGNELVLISEASRRAIRVKGDATFDATSVPTDPFSWMVVERKVNNGVVVIRSYLHDGYHLGIDKKKVFADMRGGVHCEFKIVQQKDRSVLFESNRSPRQYLTFDSRGKVSEVDSISKLEMKFRVYCKGAFRRDGLLIIQTSPTQTLFADEDGQVVGYGARDSTVAWRVHKVRPGVRMFQSAMQPDRFIQMRDGKVDAMGTGDDWCQFRVERDKYQGSFKLLSVKQNRYLALTPEGVGKAATNDDHDELVFYPEVLQFGIPKKRKISHGTPRTSRTHDSSRGGQTRRTGRTGGLSTSRTNKQSEFSPRTPQGYKSGPMTHRSDAKSPPQESRDREYTEDPRSPPAQSSIAKSPGGATSGLQSPAKSPQQVTSPAKSPPTDR